jgi:hypothetical protein
VNLLQLLCCYSSGSSSESNNTVAEQIQIAAS